MRYWNTMTKAQREACHRLWGQQCIYRRLFVTESYLKFRRRFHEFDSGEERNRLGSYFGGVVPSGIFIGIETDGHTHS